MQNTSPSLSDYIHAIFHGTSFNTEPASTATLQIAPMLSPFELNDNSMLESFNLSPLPHTPLAYDGATKEEDESAEFESDDTAINMVPNEMKFSPNETKKNVGEYISEKVATYDDGLLRQKLKRAMLEITLNAHAWRKCIAICK